MMKCRQMFAILLMLSLLCIPSALGEEVPSLLHQQVDAAAGSVSYPQVTGMSDAVYQQQANAAILAAGEVEARITRLQSLSADSVGLTQTYEALLAGDVLSVAFSAQGALRDSGFTHQWSTVNLDLTTGEVITLADLFTDEAAARQAILDYMDQQVAPDACPHTWRRGSWLPLPETFRTEARWGSPFITTWIASPRSAARPGKVTLLYAELRDLLKLGEGTVLTRLGAEESALTLDASKRWKRSAGLWKRDSFPASPPWWGNRSRTLIARYPSAAGPGLLPRGTVFFHPGG